MAQGQRGDDGRRSNGGPTRRDSRGGNGGGSGGRRGAPARQRKDVVAVLTDGVREVQQAVKAGRLTPAVRSRFQAVALLLREERARVQAGAMPEARRSERLKRLDQVAAQLAVAAVRDAGLLHLLTDDAVIAPSSRALLREMQREAGITPPAAPEAAAQQVAAPAASPFAPAGDGAAGGEGAGASTRAVVPTSVASRQLANPFLAPVFTPQPDLAFLPRRLGGWDLVAALLSSFERAGGGDAACMELPAPTQQFTPAGKELMQHQGALVAAAAQGHRTFLLADEPGLGKTAQALLAAEAAMAYPLLVVVPSVVKTNWAREAGLWVPHRSTTVVQGSGESVNGFADVVVVNYEVLDRHLGWLGDFGFRGMVVDEAHFIKNKTSQRSQNVLTIADRVRARTPDPLVMALTGTPLINDVDDFRAIWQLLGWTDGTRPVPQLLEALEELDRTPADPDFYPGARRAVVDLGIVRRRKVDVAADIPSRRVADLPVDLDGPAGRSVRAAERDLALRMVERYERALAHRAAAGLGGALAMGAEDDDRVDVVLADAPEHGSEETDVEAGSELAPAAETVAAAETEAEAEAAAQAAAEAAAVVEEAYEALGATFAAPEPPVVDAALVRRVAKAELKDSESGDGENVFSVVRRIGRAKAELAADYTAQLARSAGKVVFFAKHVEVMDAAEELFSRQGLRFSSVRGGQTPEVRQRNVDAFVNDPEVAVVVCSLTAAGVGLNLQVASDVVLAELSWTDAEQTQAIDRVHRIGQTEPVTAWRVIAAQTLDARIAAMIDSKAGLAARALDGSDEEVGDSVDVQLEALVGLLTDALEEKHGVLAP
ncbi:DEAD/DEAH box helicase [Quadrisphaera oryzae]|uniref:DEAD/DEAH box helicase n=1 Tax=Quadrisphaera sp. RL12-1S TaxID=2763011 RepID=UPI001C97F288|nr:DEAD/DEAH box helicase [Quadrisphaera sp. RL12-1S]